VFGTVFQVRCCCAVQLFIVLIRVQNGNSIQAKIQFTAGDLVLKRGLTRPAHGYFYILYLDAFMLQCQILHARGVPLLEYTNGQIIRTHCSRSSACHSAWPYATVESECLCILQLLGLIQFEMIPRNPQIGQDCKFARVRLVWRSCHAARTTLPFFFCTVLYLSSLHSLTAPYQFTSPSASAAAAAGDDAITGSDDDAPLVSPWVAAIHANSDDIEDSDVDMDIDRAFEQLLDFKAKGGKRKGPNRVTYFSTVRVRVSEFRELVLGRVHPKVIIFIYLLYWIKYINTLNADYVSRSRLHRRQH
jgi:hypothetical protein